MIFRERRGSLRLPSVMKYLVYLEFGDGFAFDTEVRLGNACLMLENTLRSTSNHHNRQNARFPSLKSIHDSERLTFVIDCHTTDDRLRKTRRTHFKPGNAA